MAMSGSTSSHSPRHFSSNSSSLNSPQTRRAATRSAVSSPWNQVVRGESEPIIAAAPPSPDVIESFPAFTATFLPVEDSSSVGESSENGNGSNGNNVKRPAWNKPSNGAASDVQPVMGAFSWPALSESARNTVKSSESSTGLTDGSSVTQLQGTGSTPCSSPRQVSDNAHTSSTAPTRQKPMKRNGSSASSNGGHSQLFAPQAATGSHNPSARDHGQRSGFVPQPHNVSDHPQQPNSFRHRNGGSHQRGDGSQHHNYGNRREQDRGNQEWNTHRNFSGRDTHIPPRNVSRFIRPPPPPPPTSGPYMPPAIRHFGTPIGFHELPHPLLYVAAPPPDPLRGVSFVPPMPPHYPMFLPAPDPQLPAKIVNQIEYYFSNGNLIKDTYLRQNMDSQGWVSIKLIAGFNKVMHLTDSVQLILDAVRTSSVVEVQGEKIRRRNDWRRWILPPPVPFPTVTSPQADGKSSHDMLAEQVQRIDLQKANSEGAGDVQSDALQNRPSFGDLNGPMQLSGGEGIGQVGIQGSDHSISASNQP